jgi:hypothetical protein
MVVNVEIKVSIDWQRVEIKVSIDWQRVDAAIRSRLPDAAFRITRPSASSSGSTRASELNVLVRVTS